MIEIVKTIKVSSGATLPINYVWSGSVSCIGFDSQSGTSSTNTFVTTIQISDDSCFDSLPTATVIVTDKSGCKQTLTIDLSDPCTTLQISQPYFISTAYEFGVQVLEGNPPYAYEWLVDVGLWENPITTATINGAGKIKMDLRSNITTPISTMIGVRVRDADGCEATRSFSYVFCRPNVSNVSTVAIHNGQLGSASLFTAPNVQLTFRPCVGTTIDYSSINFTPPTGFAVEYPWLATGNNPNLINIEIDGSVSTGIYEIPYTISDNNGIPSLPGKIVVSVPNPSVNQIGIAPVAINAVQVVNVDSVPGDEYALPLEPLVLSTTPIDWSTVVLLTTPVDGTVAYSAANREIVYTQGPSAVDVDSVSWRVSNTNGVQSNSAIFAMKLYQQAAPVAIADNECAVCGEPSVFTDVTANDIGSSIATESLQIVTAPPSDEASVVISQDGYISITPVDGLTTSTLLSYKVANSDGVYSNTATVTYQLYCAGISPSTPYTITCIPNQQASLEALVGGTVSSGTVWTETTTSTSNTYTVQGGTITGAEAGNIDFTGINPGIYTFTGTSSGGGCVSTSQVIVIQDSYSYPVNNDCSNSITITYPALTRPSTIFAQTNVGTCPGLLEPTESTIWSVPTSVEQNPPSWNTTRSGDLWYKFTLPLTGSSVDVTLEITGVPYGTTSGITNPQIAAYRSAATPCITDDLILVDDASELSGGQSVTLELIGLTPGVSYWLRISAGGSDNEGTFDVVLTDGV